MTKSANVPAPPALLGECDCKHTIPNCSAVVHAVAERLAPPNAAALRPARRPKVAPDIRPVPLP